MAYTEAQKNATRKYNEKAYDRLAVTVPKGDREKIRIAAEKCGMSLNEFVNKAIREKMKKNSESS